MRAKAATIANRSALLSSEPSSDRIWRRTPVRLRCRGGSSEPRSSRGLGTRSADSSSSSVPSTVTVSPTDTMWSRPGQATVAEPSTGSTAMGASAPNRARREAYRSTTTSEVTNRVPPSSI